MSEIGVGGSVATGRAAALRTGTTEVVLATPGVTRIEPSLRSALRRITGPTELASVARGMIGDGVHVVRHDRTVTVTAEVVLDGSRSVLDVAEDVQRRVVAFVTAEGYLPGPVEVHVLGIEPGPGERRLRAVPSLV